ncbi:MAG: CRISPR-associated endonuclease Cas6 [Bacteroidota bacterium]
MPHQDHLIKTLQATFDLPISGNKISAWRGAFIAMAGIGDSIFHNHDNSSTAFSPIVARSIKNGNRFSSPSKNIAHKNGTKRTGLPTAEQKKDKYLYRYPLIQYRSVKGKAAIFAINDGVTAFQNVLADTDWEIRIDGKRRRLRMEGLEMKDHCLRVTKEMHTYRLHRWMPFNDVNYQLWINCEDLGAKVELLERILPGQLLNFCSGVGWQVPQRFDLHLIDLHKTHSERYHNIQRPAFDVTYCANLLLPDGMAVGKAVSQGFGCQYPNS